MGKALIVMRSVALFFALYSFLFSQSDPDPQRFFYSKTGKELFIEQKKNLILVIPGLIVLAFIIKDFTIIMQSSLLKLFSFKMLIIFFLF